MGPWCQKKKDSKNWKNIFELLKFVIFKIAMTNEKMPETYKKSLEEVYSLSSPWE